MQQPSHEEGGESEPRPRPEESREVAPLDAAEVEHSEGDAEVLERHRSGFADDAGTNPRRSQSSGEDSDRATGSPSRD
jgi:hypothetical protein